MTLACLLSPRCLLAVALLAPSVMRGGVPPEQAFSEMKVYSAGGKSWRVAVEDWDGAARRVSDDRDWASSLKQDRARVDAWIAKRQDRVAWACGWFHDFVSPKDASRLTWTPDIPGEDVKFLSSPSDSHVEITPKLMGGWVYFFRSRHADMIERAAQLYRLTHEEKYAKWAADQLDFYADHYLEWKPSAKDHAARLFGQTLDEATTSIKYANTVRLLGDFAGPERRRHWREKLFDPIVRALNKTYLRIHNIALWHRCAVAEIALVFHDEPLWRQAIDGRFGVRDQIAHGVTADYLWYEQSLHYNQFVVQAMTTLFTMASLEGKVQELAHELAVTEDLMLSPIYLRFPNGLLPNPADGTGIEKAPDLPFLATTYRIFPTTIALAEASKQKDWNTLLDPPAAPPRPVELPVVKSQNLEASRMALLVQGSWQVFFHYGQLTASHAQSEALNFSASFNGVDITHDPGTVGYGSPFHQEYYSKGLNHNIPLIDGEGSLPPQPGELLAFSPERAEISAAQPFYRPGVTASRTLRIEGDKLIDTATVHCKSGPPHALGLSLHVQGKVRLPSTFAPDPAFSAHRPASFRYWNDATTTTGTDKISFDVDYGSTVLRITFSVPGKFRVWHGSSPDVPPNHREAFYLETEGAEATFTTVIEPKLP